MTGKRISEKQFAVLAILAMEFNGLAMSAVSPALADLGQAFPNVSQTYMSMLSTVPALMCIPVSVLSTSLVGRKITFRHISVIGVILQLLGGLMPMLATTFFEVLVWRCVFGIGMGIMSPLGSALMFSLFTKEEAEIQSSRDTMANSIGAVVYQLAGGILCAQFGWRCTFLVYVLLIPTLTLTMIGFAKIKLANEKFLVVRQPEMKAGPKKRSQYGIPFYAWCSLYALYCILFYPLITDSSVVVLNNNYGSADSVSVILSVYTLFAVVGGFLYQSKEIRNLNSKICAPIFASNALAFGIIILAKNVFTMILGAAIFGIGYGMFTAAIIIFAGYSVPKELRMGVMARMLIFTGLGEFVSAFVMEFIKTRIFHSGYERFSFLFSAVCLAILAVVFLIKPKSQLSDDRIEEPGDTVKLVEEIGSL